MLNTDAVSDEVVQAVRAAAELEPAVEAFAEATGALEPVREATGWLGDSIRYRREARLAKVLIKAAEKVKASGAARPRSPRQAAPRRGGGRVNGGRREGMQARWATLLANAATDNRDKIRLAYSKILAELEPKEALLLDRLWKKTPNPAEEPFETVGYETTNDLVDQAGLYNLERLGLLKWIWSTGTTWDELSNGQVTLKGVQLTELGWEFVKACHPPS